MKDPEQELLGLSKSGGDEMENQETIRDASFGPPESWAPFAASSANTWYQ